MTVGNFSLPTQMMTTCTDGILYCFSKCAGDVTTGLFWVLALLTFMVVIFLAAAQFGSIRAFGFAAFVGLVGGIWLSIITLIPWWIGSIFIIVGIIGIVVMIISER